MSASEIETNETLVSNDDTDLTKLSAEELLAVVAELRQENKTLLKAKNKVGLTFKRIPEDGNDSITRLEEGHFPYLTKIDSLSVTKDESTDGNISLIEGENLAVLAALQMTHKEKVDVIYIDPPYNTGNDDFIYEDKRLYRSDISDLYNLEETLDGRPRTVGKDDPFRHSKWLSFMERRLFLARELLADNGVIFVSIDDNEHARLKSLMDSVFGSNNFLGTIIQDKQNSQNDSINIQKNHEYIVVFRKNEIYLNGSIQPTIVSPLVQERKVEKDNKGKYFFLGDPLTTRSAAGMLNARKNLGYTVYFNENTNHIIPLMDYDIELATKSNKEEEVYKDNLDLIAKGYIKIRPPKVRGYLGRWTWSFEKFIKDIDSIVVTKTKAGYTVRSKKIVDEDKVKKVANGYVTEIPSGSKGLKSVSQYSTNEGSKTLSSIIDAGSFNNPKNMEMIKSFINSYNKKDTLILDFFAGSGTTGHAVAELNKEDGGNRSAILVTNNEGGIARNVTRERIARVLTGENWADGKDHEPLPGNLSYYTLDFKKISSNPLSAAQMMEGNFEHMVSLENNALEVIASDANEDYAIYRNSRKLVFVWKNLFSLYDGEFKDIVDELKQDNPEKEIVVYVPSDSKEDAGNVEGHETISFPHAHIERYETMIATMRRNQTLPNAK